MPDDTYPNHIQTRNAETAREKRAMELAEQITAGWLAIQVKATRTNGSYSDTPLEHVLLGGDMVQAVTEQIAEAIREHAIGLEAERDRLREELTHSERENEAAIQLLTASMDAAKALRSVLASVLNAAGPVAEAERHIRDYHESIPLTVAWKSGMAIGFTVGQLRELSAQCEAGKVAIGNV